MCITFFFLSTTICHINQNISNKWHKKTKNACGRIIWRFMILCGDTFFIAFCTPRTYPYSLINGNAFAQRSRLSLFQPLVARHLQCARGKIASGGRFIFYFHSAARAEPNSGAKCLMRMECDEVTRVSRQATRNDNKKQALFDSNFMRSTRTNTFHCTSPARTNLVTAAAGWRNSHHFWSGAWIKIASCW